MAFGQATKTAENRVEPRDEVYHRARVTGSADGLPTTLLIVNISPNGLMARSDADYAIGDRMRVHLPAFGQVLAEIRWSLGGRIGCQFDRTIALDRYYAVLAAMAKP